jgi:nitrile hydratase accessory protein
VSEAGTLPIEGPAAPPRSNGELVFAAPWESRLFGMTMALIERGAFTWGDFQPELVASIRAWEAAAAPGDPYSYYARWQEALERVLARATICSRGDLESRAEAFAERPPGHDHPHPRD